MYVKNAVVTMDWLVEGFIETKAGGFIAAIHEYETENGTVPVVFMNGRAFCVYDEEEGRLSTTDEIKVALKKCYDADLQFDEEMEEQDMFVLCTDLETQNDYVMDEYGITPNQIEDMEDRIFDLKGYESEEVME